MEKVALVTGSSSGIGFETALGHMQVRQNRPKKLFQKQKL